MNSITMKRLSIFFLLGLLSITFAIGSPTLANTGAPLAAETKILDGVAADQIDSTLAKMSDEQVRSLLISELSSKLATSPAAKKSGGLIKKTSKWLHLLDDAENKKEESSGFLSLITRFPDDYLAAARTVGNGSMGNFIFTLGMLLIVFGAAWGTEFFCPPLHRKFQKTI